jgi:hypothetical protein
MLSDKHYRKKVVENIKDPAVKSFWVDEFANYNERYMQEAGDAIKNKIGQFTSNPLIRNIVGQPHSSFDLREVMDGKKILIANLSKGLVGESNANLLGSMLTTRLYLAAMSRADLSAEQLKQMPNFYFYVDEFQSFANATFADILSEARKYKLNLTIAHQYIEQMEEEVRNAVFGNVGTIIAFRVGPFDAEVLETVFTPKFLAADIVNLGFAQIYLSLMIDGIGSQPFSAVTLPPIVPPHVSYKEMAIAESRRQFAGSREQVEEAINAWHAEVHADIKSPREREPSSAPVSGSVVPKAPASSVRPAGASTRAVQSGEKVPLRAREAVRTSVAAAATHREVAVPVPRAEVSVAEALVLERVVLREEAVPVVAMVRPVAHAPRKLQSMARMPSSATVVGEAGQRVRRATKDLSELRSVLKNIASGDKKEVKTENAVPGAAHDAAAQAKDDTREALKSALAAVVGATVLQSASHADVSVPAKPSSVVTDAVLSET